MSVECLVCGERLRYLKEAKSMTCTFCKNTFVSTTECVNGHYVCDDCHVQGLDVMLSLLDTEDSTNPLHIMTRLMDEEACHMHGPEHHILVGLALITAFKNAGGDIGKDALLEMVRRGKEVPGGTCGLWGACGAGISTGIFMSIIMNGSPLTVKPFSLANLMTSKALRAIGEVGGPRCCKRDSYLAIKEAIKFVNSNFSIKLGDSDVVCHYSSRNNQCIGSRCPFMINKENKEQVII